MARLWLCLILPILVGAARGQTAEAIEQSLLTGDYEDAITDAESALRNAPASEELNVLLVRSLLTVGRYEDALTAANRAIDRLSQSLRMRWTLREAALANGEDDLATEQLTTMRQLVTSRFSAYRNDPKNLLAFAEMALFLGADPKVVLDQVLVPVQRDYPDLRDVYLARGNLALDKHDYDLAAQAFGDGLARFPDDADLNYGLAQAFAPSDRGQMLDSLDAALTANPRHIPSMLLQADHAIAAEDYDGAVEQLEVIKRINPWEPEAWAYNAVIAHLRNQPQAESTNRETALRFRDNDPGIDWLIGKKLAEKYRFAEGADYQRRALAFDPGFLPAKSELASDLLRLGEEEEGWPLAQEVYEQDGYDVEAYNLVTLKDTLDQYAVLQDEHFILRLPADEAPIYGEQALALLNEARAELVARYGITLQEPTRVDVFGDQQDFAVRTFGLPDVAGFLGVCFGRVVTANGPSATASNPANWQAVLWHEFTHVITLQLTRNKMPRWLSEGISVYEELRRDPSWGMRMTPTYRQFVLDGEMHRISELSAAFLAPESPEKLQFAYFQSAMVVQFITERHGMDALRAILNDLGAGRDINEAIAAATEPMADLEDAFLAYAVDRAENLAPGLKFDEIPPEVLGAGGRGGRGGAGGGPGGIGGAVANALGGGSQSLDAWLADNPDNFFGLLAKSSQLLEAENFEAARPILERLVTLYPAQAGGGSAYPMLATVYRQLGESEAERALLENFGLRDDTATSAYARVMQLAEADSDWPIVQQFAERYLAVNPLVTVPHRYLAIATEELGEDQRAIAANRNLLRLDPPNPVEVHYRLARLLYREGSEEARRQVLMALEDAPRFRDALDLLVTINNPPEPAVEPVPESEPAAVPSAP